MKPLIEMLRKETSREFGICGTSSKRITRHPLGSRSLHFLLSSLSRETNRGEMDLKTNASIRIKLSVK